MSLMKSKILESSLLLKLALLLVLSALFNLNSLCFAKKTVSVIETAMGHRIHLDENKWHYRTRFFDVVPLSNGKFAMMQANSKKYYEFVTTKDFPKYLVIPISYRFKIEATSKWKKIKKTKFLDHNIVVYRRSVNVHARKARTTLLQLEENLDNKKDNRIRIIKGTQELWITNDFGKQLSLRKFLKVFYGCPTELGLPVRESLAFPGCVSLVNKRMLRGIKISKSKSWANFGTIPPGAKKGADLMRVLSGSSGGMLEFLYRAR